ncbi:hypothetical protein [Serratia nevei]|uniref:hypothetical protein n=1 Tax=Serratia nevei TaxID=2703794 RepID=UPI003FA6BC56
MNNYEMLQFLIEDGGWYTAVGHFDFLKSKYPDSYIRSEPPEVVRMILLVQQFNQLITPVTHQRAY